MAVKIVGGSAPVKRRGILRKFVWCLAILVALLIPLYFVATSAAFFKGVILPRIGKSINAEITVADASIHPFSQVVLRDLKVQTGGKEPLMTVPEASARYSLMDIIGGNLNVAEVIISSPQIQIVENADGTSNLDPIINSQKDRPSKPRGSQSEKPPQLDLKKFALKNGTLRQIKHHPDGTSEVIELKNVNLSAENLKNGQTGKLSLTADVKSDRAGVGAAGATSLQGNISSALDVTLDANLKPQTLKGGLKVAADALDVTPYYNLFASKPQAAASAQTNQTVSAPNTEPPPVKLPFQEFTVDLNVGRFYLRELAVTNWQMAARLEGGHLKVKPFQLVLNGAPLSLSADVDLSVPGYRYDLDLSADQVPIGPFVNSFMPKERGKHQGQLSARAQIKGAGITGASLKKNLSGQMNLNFTNANIQVMGPKLKQFLQPVALLLGVPELVQSPLDAVAAIAQVSNGKMNFNTFSLASPLFFMDTAGEMPIAEVLTNSPFNNWPVNFYLRRSLAEKARLVSGGSAPGAYLKLPNFLQVAGTLGNPSAHIEKTALVGSLLEKFGDKIPGINEKTGGLLQGVGGLLSGNTNRPANTNQVSTNKPPKMNPLDLLKKRKN